MSGLKRNIQEIYGNNNNNGPHNGNGVQIKSDEMGGGGASQLDPQSNQDQKKTRLDGSQNKQEPSRVVHLRNIPQQLSENEIIFLGLSFGGVKNVLFLRSKNQAFLEFETLPDAQLMIAHFAQTTTTFSGKKIFVQYSNHQELNTDPNNSNNLAAQSALSEALALHRASKQGGKNTVLRASIMNMIYPVTLDVLNQIFTKFGVLLKIITFNKNDKFQALIQMRDAQAAQNAKQALHGQNIYNGCCTLQIEFSKLTTLEVRFNNDKSRDYTNLLLPTGDGQNAPQNIGDGPGMGMGMSQSNMNGNSPMNQFAALQQYSQNSLIGAPPNLFAAAAAAANQMSFGGHGNNHHHNNHNNNNQMNQNQYGNSGFNPNQFQNMMQGNNNNQHGGGQNNNQSMHNSQMNNSGGGGGGGATPVLLVSNLNEEFSTPDALFTLFGVYGDVVRVKILFNKKDSALINFANSQQAQTALANLDRIKIWNKQIRVFPSKHLTVQMPKDGQPDAGLTKDFSNSPLHRFKKPGSKNFNNIFPPSQTLHLSNIPQNVQEQQLRDIFAGFGAIKGFKFFQKDRKMALLQMSSVEEATNALIATHNYQLADNMHLRVAFSKATI